MKKFDALYKTILEDISDTKISNLKKKLDQSSEDALNAGIDDETAETDLKKTTAGIKKKKLQDVKQKEVTGQV